MAMKTRKNDKWKAIIMDTDALKMYRRLCLIYEDEDEAFEKTQKMHPEFKKPLW